MRVHAAHYVGVRGRIDPWGFGSTYTAWCWPSLDGVAHQIRGEAWAPPSFWGIPPAEIVESYAPATEWGQRGEHWWLPDGRLLVAVYRDDGGAGPSRTRHPIEVAEYAAGEAAAAYTRLLCETLARHPWAIPPEAVR